MDLFFIVISRLPLIRLGEFFCCFSNSSLSISLIKVVNLSLVLRVIFVMRHLEYSLLVTRKFSFTFSFRVSNLEILFAYFLESVNQKFYFLFINSEI